MIIAPATKYKGKIYVGAYHHESHVRATGSITAISSPKDFENGFLTDTGIFLNRQDAFWHAHQCDQDFVNVGLRLETYHALDSMDLPRASYDLKRAKELADAYNATVDAEPECAPLHDKGDVNNVGSGFADFYNHFHDNKELGD